MARVHIGGLGPDVTDSAVENDLYTLLSDIGGTHHPEQEGEALPMQSQSQGAGAGAIGSEGGSPDSLAGAAVDTYGGLMGVQCNRNKGSRNTGMCGGFAFVSFFTAAQAEAAVERLDGATIVGGTVTAALATEKPKKPKGGGGGGGEIHASHLPLCPRKKGKSKVRLFKLCVCVCLGVCGGGVKWWVLADGRARVCVCELVQAKDLPISHDAPCLNH